MNHKNDIKHFVARTMAALLPPVLLVVGLYALIDPYSVVRGEAANSFTLDPYIHPTLYQNKGFMSLKALERRIGEGDTPDSYIFGSSISCYYDVDYWNKYIGSPTMPFHFDSAHEGAASMLKKIQYLKGQGIDIKHALIVLDTEAISHPLQGDNIVNLDPPAIDRQPWSPITWQYRYMRAATSTDFLVNYLPYLYDGRYNQNGPHALFEVQPMHYDVYRNEESIPLWDSIIRFRPEMFYTAGRLPADREPHCADTARIDSERERYYRAIACELTGTDYRVVISPTIDRDTLSDRDRRMLGEIFGTGRVHDYSASLSHIALADSNWYDRRHYRAPVAQMIIDSIYAKAAKNQ